MQFLHIIRILLGNANGEQKRWLLTNTVSFTAATRRCPPWLRIIMLIITIIINIIIIPPWLRIIMLIIIIHIIIIPPWLRIIMLIIRIMKVSASPP